MDKFIYALNLIVDFIDMSDSITESELSNYLSYTGFEDFEVSSILAMLDIEQVPSSEYVRVFSKLEKRQFTSEALTYLEKLMLSGVLDFLSMEEIIEKAENSGSYKIPVDQIKELTFFKLLEKKGNLFGGHDNYIQ